MICDSENDNNTQSAIEAGMAMGTPHDLGDGLNAILVPPGASVHMEDMRARAEKFALRPHRKTGTFALATAASFVAFVNAHKTEATAVYAGRDNTTFKAVINDHAGEATAGPVPDSMMVQLTDEGEKIAEAEVPPALLEMLQHATQRLGGHRDFLATYSCPLSVEWKRWMAKSQHGENKQGMKHTDFVQFLEDNLPDIIKPVASVLLQAVRSFEAKKDVKFGSAVRLDNGDVSFKYTDETVQVGSGEGAIVLPDQFTICVPVFDGGGKYEVDARVRYRIGQGGLVLWYELVRPHKVLEHAFAGAMAEVAAGINHTSPFRESAPDPVAAGQKKALTVPIYEV